MYFRNKIIAEVGSVHDGSFGNACRLVDLASECDADFIKFQTHLAEAETLINAPMPSYFKGEPSTSILSVLSSLLSSGEN